MAFKTTVKIWLLSLLFGTLFFTVYAILNDSIFDEKSLATGLSVNLLMSIPCFLLLWMVIDVCVRTGTQGMNLLLVVLTSSVAFAVASFIGAGHIFNLDHPGYTVFLYTSVLSAVIAIILQHHALLNISSPNQQDSHEI